MTKPWYKRIIDYLSSHPDDTPALIVATPLVTGPAVVKPLTIIVPVHHVKSDPVVVKAKPARTVRPKLAAIVVPTPKPKPRTKLGTARAALKKRVSGKE